MKSSWIVNEYKRNKSLAKVFRHASVATPSISTRLLRHYAPRNDNLFIAFVLRVIVWGKVSRVNGINYVFLREKASIFGSVKIS